MTTTNVPFTIVSVNAYYNLVSIGPCITAYAIIDPTIALHPCLCNYGDNNGPLQSLLMSITKALLTLHLVTTMEMLSPPLVKMIAFLEILLWSIMAFLSPLLGFL